MIDISHSGHYVGDCRDLLKQLPDACVQTCITSPPYWGLRDYGTATWEGGDPTCDHTRVCGGTKKSTLGAFANGMSEESVAGSIKRSFVPYRSKCRKCGAVRCDRQIGMEPNPEAFIEILVDVFRDVRRVLRDDGTLWLNLGDCYAHDNRGGHSGASSATKGRRNAGATHKAADMRGGKPSGYKSKDMIGQPWMAAFALRADGWYLRADIIWHKANPMPESVADRPTKSHEYLFLLAKSERYFYDAAAVREPVTGGMNAGGVGVPRKASANAMGARNNSRWAESMRYRDQNPDGFRNRRSVWTTTSQPYSGAHFATFPPALIEPCVLAGSRVGDIVLDPFFGSGTTGEVAEKHGRRWIGFDLNPAYEALQKERTAQRSLVLRGES